MKRSTKKVVAILLVAMFMLTLLPMTGFAASTNSVDRVPSVSVGHTFSADTAPVLKIVEKDDSFRTASPGETFELRLTNATWREYDTPVVSVETEATAYDDTDSAADYFDVEILTNTVATVTVYDTGTKPLTMEFPLITRISGDGPATVTIDSRDSAVTAGTLTFANAAVGNTTTTISTVNTFARYGNLGDIRIDELLIGALGESDQTIRLKLPPRFEWSTPGSMVATGGLTGTNMTITRFSGRDLEIAVSDLPTDRAQRGSIFLRDFVIRADRDAPYGDVVVAVDGSVITTQDVLMARYMAYDVEVSVAAVNEVVAGRWQTHNKTANITIEENIPGSMIAGREIVVVLPDWVKIVTPAGITVKGTTSGGLSGADLERSARQNEFYFMVPAGIDDTVRSKYVFDLALSTEADKSGDIYAEVSGAGVETQEVLIATAVAPITAEVASTDLKIGLQNQAAPDIVITESRRWAIDDGSYLATGWTANNQLLVTLPTGIAFSSPPTVEVTDGNLDIGVVTVDTGGRRLVIPVTSNSTTPSEITISNVRLTLDRTVPEGAFHATIGGSAIVKNWGENATITTPMVFDKDRVVRFHFADVITPAPGEMRAITTFTIGDRTYTRVEAGEAVDYEMDVAPYITDGRTYLPVRYVAYALNVSPGNILWDPASLTVTIFKGDRIVQLVIHTNNLLVNGVNVTMDVPAVTVEGRTMLPVRWVAQAFGAQVDWDAETQTVTVTQ